MNWRVPLADLNFDDQEEAAALSVIKSGWLSMGTVTKDFEASFAAFTGAEHAIAITNATAGLHLACLALAIGPGDEVILPSLTFVATANAVRYTGADVVFADIESFDWLTISPQAIEEAITPRTKAIIVMHYGGNACDMPAIVDIANRYDLPIIEDAAHAVGSSLDGRALGTLGKIGVYSFFANKNLSTGEGGMIVTDDAHIAEKVRLLRSHGMTTLSWDRHAGHAYTYDVVDLGYNYRIDEIRSAIGKIQLSKVKEGNMRRGELSTYYRKLINDALPGISVPFTEQRGSSSYHIFPILLPERVNRLQVMESMKECGIQTSLHYPCVHQFKIYAQANQTKPTHQLLKITEEVAKRELTLPLYPGMQEEQVNWVIEALRSSLH